jgi:predicted DNA-binding protein (MmcQ/YjbR family)
VSGDLGLPELRRICLAFRRPRLRGKIFAMRHSLHEVARWSVWFKAPPGAQEVVVGSDGRRFFVPPYVGGKGWIGAYLDVEQDWEELADLIEESYRLTAPKRLAALLDQPPAAT